MDRYWRFKWEHDGITVADWMLGESDWFDLFYNIFSKARVLVLSPTGDRGCVKGFW